MLNSAQKKAQKKAENPINHLSKTIHFKDKAMDEIFHLALIQNKQGIWDFIHANPAIDFYKIIQEVYRLMSALPAQNNINPHLLAPGIRLVLNVQDTLKRNNAVNEIYKLALVQNEQGILDFLKANPAFDSHEIMRVTFEAMAKLPESVETPIPEFEAAITLVAAILTDIEKNKLNTHPIYYLALADREEDIWDYYDPNNIKAFYSLIQSIHQTLYDELIAMAPLTYTLDLPSKNGEPKKFMDIWKDPAAKSNSHSSKLTIGLAVLHIIMLELEKNWEAKKDTPRTVPPSENSSHKPKENKPPKPSFWTIPNPFRLTIIDDAAPQFKVVPQPGPPSQFR